MTKILIKTEYITLGQFLKYADIIHDGGAAKYFVKENKILVDDLDENRRGRKLYPGTIVEILDKKYLLTTSNEN